MKGQQRKLPGLQNDGNGASHGIARSLRARFRNIFGGKHDPDKCFCVLRFVRFNDLLNDGLQTLGLNVVLVERWG